MARLYVYSGVRTTEWLPVACGTKTTVYGEIKIITLNPLLQYDDRIAIRHSRVAKKEKPICFSRVQMLTP